MQAFVGGAGNDIFIAGPGGNHGFDGGGGVNTLSYIAATSSVYFDLTDQIIYDNLNGATVTTDRVANIKAFIGGSGNNVFVSSGPSGDIINGGAGGINTLQYSSPTANTTFDLTAATATANGVADIFANMQILVGSSGNDTFIGGPGNHTFIGNGGVNAISYANTTGNTEFDLVHDLAYNDHQGKSPVTVDSFSGVQVFVVGSSKHQYFYRQRRWLRICRRAGLPIRLSSAWASVTGRSIILSMAATSFNCRKVRPPTYILVNPARTR